LAALPAERVGGHLVAESLQALGADTALGVPGQHALGVFDGLRRSGLRFVGFRTEVAASFAAHGYAAVSGRAAPLVVSTGPGALMSLAGLQEAETTGVPVVCICSEIPRDGLRRNRGFVHELRDQIAHFRPLVKGAFSVMSDETLPDMLAEAWRVALTPPSGPVFVQIPVDVLSGATGVPPVERLDGAPAPRPPRDEALDRAAALIEAADSVAIFAGGGVLRAGAWDELRALAERLGAPVAMTYGGKGAFPPDHPLCAGSANEDPRLLDMIGGAGVAVVVGASLSEETSNHYAMRFEGRLVQVEADPSRVGTTYPAVAVVGDARAALAGLLERLGERLPTSDGATRAAEVRARIDEVLAGQGRELERTLLATIDSALPPGAVTAWDMTIMAYWAALDFPVRGPRRYVYPQGSGALGYGYPGGLGAKAALPGSPVLAVAGDGGVLYGLAELATARQHGLDAKLLVIDDGGYGVLREYQRDTFGERFATDLVRPDFTHAFEGFGVPSRRIEPEALGEALEWAFLTEGPAALVMEARPEMFLPTHLGAG
jgi:acetolactate synthase I/II/III large subunit